MTATDVRYVVAAFLIILGTNAVLLSVYFNSSGATNKDILFAVMIARYEITVEDLVDCEIFVQEEAPLLWYHAPSEVIVTESGDIMGAY